MFGIYVIFRLYENGNGVLRDGAVYAKLAVQPVQEYCLSLFVPNNPIPDPDLLSYPIPFHP